MKQLIDGAFEVAATLFNKVPVLKKLEGYRSVFGFIGLIVCTVLKANGIGDAATIQNLEYGFIAFTGFALNAKGR